MKANLCIFLSLFLLPAYAMQYGDPTFYLAVLEAQNYAAKEPAANPGNNPTKRFHASHRFVFQPVGELISKMNKNPNYVPTIEELKALFVAKKVIASSDNEGNPNIQFVTYHGQKCIS